MAGFLIGLATVGAVCFVALARLLGILSSDDAQWLDRAVGGTLGGKVGKVVRFFVPSPAQSRMKGFTFVAPEPDGPL